MHKFIYILFVAFLSCASREGSNISSNIESIDFDTTQATELKPEDLECLFIPLETRDECLLSLSLDDIKFSDDKLFIINHNNNLSKVFIFTKDGKFVLQLGDIGEGPGEYKQPYRLYINNENSTITVADRGANKLIIYDLTTYKHISTIHIPFNFLDCTWLSSDMILWCYAGGINVGNREWYYSCITNQKMEIISKFHKVTPSSYVIPYITLYKYNNNTYTGLPFSPFIYQINEDRMDPVWKLSFGKKELPPASLVVDEKENSLAWLNRVIQSNYINSFHAHETSDYLGVSFYGTTFQRHLGFYDKKKKKTDTYTARDFMEQLHLYGVYEIINTYDDYFVARIEAKMLKTQIPQREDLRIIAASMTEEDNPVLCLFKFK